MVLASINIREGPFPIYASSLGPIPSQAYRYNNGRYPGASWSLIPVIAITGNSNPTSSGIELDHT